MLIEERDKVDRAIAVLQGTVSRRGRPPGRRGPGRPPGSGTKAAKPGAKRSTMSPAARKKIAARMRAYWAARNKGAKKAVKIAKTAA